MITHKSSEHDDYFINKLTLTSIDITQKMNKDVMKNGYTILLFSYGFNIAFPRSFFFEGASISLRKLSINFMIDLIKI